MPQSRELYDILGVNPNATDNEISKAYKVLARTHHPDKGGDEEIFKKVQHAYDVLSDPKMKEYYDMTGVVPGSDGGGGGMQNPFEGGHPFANFGVNMADLFGMFGGGGMRGPGGRGFNRKRPGKAPPRVEHLSISLSQFYHGGIVTIMLNREKLCSSCKGCGSKVLKTCGTCGGSGQSVQNVMIGPGMMMQAHGPCVTCEGKGEQRGEACGDCEAKGLTRQRKNIEVHIRPGSKAGDVISFENEASDNQDYEIPSADLNIILQTADDLFGWTRNGDNLYNTVTISLIESLCGCVVEIGGWPGLMACDSDCKVAISIPRGIQNGEEVVVNGKGIVGGNLVLKVSVAVKESEQHVLMEHRESLAGIFGYHLGANKESWTSKKN